MILSFSERTINIIIRNKFEGYGDFCYLICCHFSETKNKLEFYKRALENKDI